MTPDADQLRQAAEAIDESHPEIAELLRGLIDRPDGHRMRIQRRATLRQFWRSHFPLLTRTRAAKRIAVEWALFEPSLIPIVPRSKRDFLQRLHDISLPLRWRQIASELDADRS